MNFIILVSKDCKLPKTGSLQKGEGYKNGEAYNWSSIAILRAKGTSFMNQNYDYVHPNPKAGSNYYRLKLVDMDGKFYYSRILEIDCQKNNLVTLKNNITENNIYLQSAANSKVLRISLFSSEGKEILELDSFHDEINMQKYPGGMYLLKISDEKGNVQIEKIIKL